MFVIFVVFSAFICAAAAAVIFASSSTEVTAPDVPPT